MKLAVTIVAALLLAQELPPQDTPKDILDFFRTAVEALADKDADGFLDHFDSKMSGYSQLSSDVQSLLDRSEVSSSVEFVSDQGDASKRPPPLDWLLQIDQDPPRRKVVKCGIEKRGTKWKIVSFDPVGFFGP